MTENTDPPPYPTPTPDPTPDDHLPDSQEKGSGRFAVYDTVELRYRGGVHTGRKGADAFKRQLVDRKARKASELTVREV